MAQSVSEHLRGSLHEGRRKQKGTSNKHYKKKVPSSSRLSRSILRGLRILLCGSRFCLILLKNIKTTNPGIRTYTHLEYRTVNAIPNGLEFGGKDRRIVLFEVVNGIQVPIFVRDQIDTQVNTSVPRYLADRVPFSARNLSCLPVFLFAGVGSVAGVVDLVISVAGALFSTGASTFLAGFGITRSALTVVQKTMSIYFG